MHPFTVHENAPHVRGAWLTNQIPVKIGASISNCEVGVYTDWD